MSRFIQSLESRVLLSTTPASQATLQSDQGAIIADLFALRSAGATYLKTLGGDGKAVAADLKGASNPTLLRTARTDGNKLAAVVKRDGLASINKGVSLTRRGVADGEKLLSKSSSKLQARVAGDATALRNLATGPVAAVESDVAATTFISDLNALLAANSGNAALAGAISTAKADLAVNGAAVRSATTKLSSDLNTLASDLGSGGSVGTTPSGLPNLVGSYSGISTQTSGNHPGRQSTLAMTISTESTSGAFSGSMVISRTGATTFTATLTGTITASGAFTATLSNASGQSVMFTGQLTANGRTLSGTDTSSNGSGTFTMTMM
ncbi:MAG TPA: hypothetical protein VN541_10050 [Tepidisphaeraceae bacterium]|nr:hypothetical protein [Tepidisphaeraceae bacterium]